MGVAVRLREDFSASRLRDLAKGSKCPNQTRRLLAVAEIYDGRGRGRPDPRHSRPGALAAGGFGAVTSSARLMSVFCSVATQTP